MHLIIGIMLKIAPSIYIIGDIVIEEIKKQCEIFIESDKNFIKSLKLSQKIFKKNSTVYPPFLDSMIEEACRDISCLIRKIEIFKSKLNNINDVNLNNCPEHIKSVIMPNLLEIKSLHVQCLKKTDDIILELNSLNDIDKELLKNNGDIEICEKGDYYDNEEGEEYWDSEDCEEYEKYEEDEADYEYGDEED